MTDAIKTAKAGLEFAALEYTAIKQMSNEVIRRLSEALSALIGHAEALEKQRGAVLGEEGREFCRILRVNGSNDAADFIEGQAALTALPEDLEGLVVAADATRDKMHGLLSILTQPALIQEADILLGKLAQALRAYAAREAQRGRVDAEVAAALGPFADVGVWLFARPDIPDDTPMVEFSRLNTSNGALTRGHFKAAHTALSILDTAKPAEARPPDPWDALVRDVEAEIKSGSQGFGFNEGLRWVRTRIARHRPKEGE